MIEGEVIGTDLKADSDLSGGKLQMVSRPAKVHTVVLGVSSNASWILYDGEPPGGTLRMKFPPSATVVTPVVFPNGLKFYTDVWISLASGTGKISFTYS